MLLVMLPPPRFPAPGLVLRDPRLPTGLLESGSQWAVLADPPEASTVSVILNLFKEGFST